MILRRWPVLLIVLILSLAITSNQIMDASCSINRGVTWFLNSDSKVYSPTIGSWQDIDLSGDSDIPDGATGVILEIVNIDTPGNPHIGQVRAKGSTDDRTSGAQIGGTTQIMAFVKLDANKIFQTYRDNVNIRFIVRGYTGADVIFFDNWSDVAGGHSTGITYTVNVGGSPYNVPPNSIVILEIYNEVATAPSQADLLFSRYGTSLTVGYGQGVTGAHQYIMVGVDSSSRFQHRRTANTDYNNFHLVGYIKSVGFWRTSASSDVLPSGTTTGSWTDIDMTSYLSNSSATIALLMAELQPSVTQPMQVDFRENGSSDDQHLYGNLRNNNPRTRIFYLVGVDDAQIMEAWITQHYIDAFVLGGTIDVSSPNTPENPLCEGQTNPTNIITFTPTFSWTFSDPDTGDSQTAYQLQVSTDPDGGGTILLDTGKVTSSSSSILYSGSALSRGVTYHWHVKTWDTRELESTYTADQTFKINQLPIASNLKTEGLIDPQELKTFTPTFSWTYQDPDGDTQNQYEIEVGTSLDGNDMWDPSAVSGSDTSIQYNGNPLSICTEYHVRVRVYDGFEWSNDWIRGTFQIRGATVETSTDLGTAQFDTDIGCLTKLNAVNEDSLPNLGKPELDFVHGFFSIEITNLNPGDTVNASIRLPRYMFEGTEYWVYSSSGWYPITLSDNDGDNFIIIQLVEGGLGDDDPTDGVIKMVGGPGQPRLPPVAGVLMPTDKVSVITPYLAITFLITALITSLSFRKKSKKVLIP